MLLGLSGLNQDEKVSFEAVVSSGEGDGGVAHGQLLSRLPEAMWEGDPSELAAIQDEVTSVVGGDALVDAVAVSANFHMMTRISDGTGTTYGATYFERSEKIRKQIGVNDLTSRRPPVSS